MCADLSMTAPLEHKPWHRQDGETRKAYHAFCHFRNLPNWDRSVVKAFNAHVETCKKVHVVPQTHGAAPSVDGQHIALWRQWRIRYQWETRADLHDAEVDEQQRLKQIQEIHEMNERHASLAAAFQNQIVQQFTALMKKTGEDGFIQLSPKDMAQWLDKATAVERRARGQATDIVQSKTEEATVPLDLNSLTEEELALFEKLAAKAGVGVKQGA
jgi:hypothetical protein